LPRQSNVSQEGRKGGARNDSKLVRQHEERGARPREKRLVLVSQESEMLRKPLESAPAQGRGIIPALLKWKRGH